MARKKIDEITINGWTDEGVAWTHAKKPSGFRNRRDRRAGVRYERKHGPHHLIGTRHAQIDEDMPYAEHLVDGRQTSIWAFKAGFVYEVEAEIDEEPTKLYIDARDKDRLDELSEGIVIQRWRAMRPDEIAEMTGDDPSELRRDDDSSSEDEQHLTPSDDDGPSVDDEPDVVEPDPTAEIAAQLDAVLTTGTPEYDAMTAKLEDDTAGEPVEEPQGGVHPEAGVDVQNDAQTDDADEASEGEDDFPGVIADWETLVSDLTDEDLAGYAEKDHRVGIRDLAAAEIARRAEGADKEE